MYLLAIIKLDTCKTFKIPRTCLSVLMPIYGRAHIVPLLREFQTGIHTQSGIVQTFYLVFFSHFTSGTLHFTNYNARNALL